NLLLMFSSVGRFILSVANPAKLLVYGRGLYSVALSDELNESLASVNALTQFGAQVACTSAKDVLHINFVTKELKSVSHQLASTAQFLADGGNEDSWMANHETQPLSG